MAKEDAKREERIIMEIVVDAYNEQERAMGWYCYLEDKLKFPFAAKCVGKRQVSPLRPGRRVTVTGMADSDECNSDMFVLIDWDDDDELAVPLAQLLPVKGNAATRQAVEDWHYWVRMGYSF